MKNYKSFVIAILGIISMVSICQAVPVEWVRQSDSPVLDTGGPSPYESYGVNRPSVLLQDGIYKMWYCGYRTGPSPREGICYATSTDKGLTWTKHGTVLEVTEEWERNSPPETYNYVNYPTVVYEEGMYKMWYNATTSSLGYATSTDGINWDNKTQQLGHGYVYAEVVKGPSDYKLYYNKSGLNGIYVMESSDGGVSDPWEVANEDNPILMPGDPEEWDSLKVRHPNVRYEPETGKFQMWYSGEATSNAHRIGFALSDDGLTWEKDITNPVLEPVPETWERDAVTIGSVVFDSSDSMYRMFYGGYHHGHGAIGLAAVPEPPCEVDMVLIPGGEFEMGDHHGDGYSDELPLHAVLLDAFFMSKYEITNRQYCNFLNSTDVKVEDGVVYATSDSTNNYPYLNIYPVSNRSQIDYNDLSETFSVRSRDSNSMADHPVIFVSWYGAKAFCDSYGYRLPTEAEWEYAARGGCHSPYYKYPWCSNTIDCSKTNYNNCNPLGLNDYPHTSPVGYYNPNNYGLYDMTGNADEFCSDWYDGNYYSVSPYNNPTGPDNGTYPVIRGANWDSAGNNRCRLAYRAWISSRNARGGDNGFRVARDEPPCWREQEKLLASDGVSNAGFGHSVSVSGDYAIVGAYGDDDNGTYSGSAYIFKWDGTSWIEQQKLLASDGAAHDHFGHSVFVSGDYAIVGAVFDDDDDNGTNSGSVYIFKRDGTVWSEQVKLIASDGADGDFFGYSISICGDYAIVGACLDDDNGTYSGSAYIFKKSDTSGDPNWYEEAKLTASDGAADDRFGRGVSVSGDYAIVGAYWNDDNGSKSGSAYIFKKSDTPGDPNWYEQDKLTASDAAAGDEFGIGVSVSGDYAIVGAVFNDDNGAESGSAYIFKRDGMVWSEQVKLIASDGEDNDNFGYSVSVSGDYAIVGAYGDDSRTGSAYIFKCDGTVWGEQVKLIASDDAAYDLFGTSVSISGYYAIVGAYGNDDKGSSSGSAYVFDNICPELPCSGRIVAWGTDIEGQASPPAGNDFVAIAAGFYHGIALKSDGSIVGWGKNNYGQASPPVGNDFTAISTGGWHGIALKSDGSIVGWGVDDGSPYDYGQANPPAGNDFTAIAAGGYYNIALKSDGSIVGWGLDGSPYDYGQANPPAGNDFVAIAAGHAYSIALKCDGSIVGWGADWFGQANPPAGNDFTAISAGVYHNLALKKDGSIVGWGRNLEGQTTPPAGNDFVAVAAGDIHSLALKSDGSIVGWGDDSVGQASPPAGNNFTAIAAGDYHSLALTCEPEPSNSAPVAVCQDLTVVADSNCEGFVTAEDVNDGSFDPDGDSISFSIDPCGPYLLGETVVTLTVSDGVASDTCEATVTVVDTTAPVVIVGDMAAVWPANHKYREFKLSDLVVSVDDACGGLLDVDAVGTIVSIYSDEPEDAKGNGDGKTTDDIVILGASSFKVRSERAGGGNGRVYGVTFEVVDAAGNVSVGTCYVGVAHDQSGDGPVDDGAGAGYAVP